MEILKLKIVGTSPLMMHSALFADPLRPETKAHKELTGKRVKTDSDHLAIARSEFMAGLYYSKEDGVYIPGNNFDATFYEAAKLQKLGVKWKSGAMVLEERARLIYDGPKDPDELWDDPQFRDCRGVKIGKVRIMRYRPLFLQWATECTVSFNPDVISENKVRKIILDAGELVGVCEYRPRFGRFMVQYG